MPRDVALGEGYANGEMIHPAMPGQHTGHFEYHDGSSVLLQRQNPMGDLGHRPRHRHGGRRFHGGGWGWGWGPGYVPYEPLTIEVVTKEEEDEDEKKVLSGLSGTECIERIIQVAAVAAREAVEGVERGVFKSVQDVREHIRRRVCAEVVSHQKAYCKAVQEAVKSGFEAALPHVEKALAARGVGLSDFESLSDWKGDIGAALAQGELDQLMAGVRRAQDSLIQAMNARRPTYDNYQKAKALFDEAVAQYGPPYQTTGMGVPIPNMKVLPAASAMQGASEGVRFFARQVQTLNELLVVFSKISEVLFNAGLRNEEDAVNQTTRQMIRFVGETDQMFRGIAAYEKTKQDLIRTFNEELAGRGINKTAYDSPKWFESYLAAAERVVPLPVSGGEGRALSGMDDLGLAPALILLIKVIAIVAATVVAIHAINKIVGALNSQAETARELILQRERDWTGIESGMRAQGKTQAEIDAARKSWDAGTKASVEKIPPPSGLFGGTTAAILAALGIGAALKIGGVF